NDLVHLPLQKRNVVLEMISLSLGRDYLLQIKSPGCIVEQMKWRKLRKRISRNTPTALKYSAKIYMKISYGILWIFTKTFKKIPKIVWGTAAVFGIFTAGIIFGYSMSHDSPDPTSSNASAQNLKYMNVIKGYEDLSKLYYYQGQNVSVIMDPNIDQ